MKGELTMLTPDQISVRELGSIAEFGLLLPRNQYEATFLLCPAEAGPIAVYLEGKHIFLSFHSSGTSNYSGVFVNSIRIEIDHTSVFDPDLDEVPLGSLIREADKLFIWTKCEERGFPRRLKVSLIANLPECTEGKRAGFAKWHLTVGPDSNSQSLITVDSIKS